MIIFGIFASLLVVSTIAEDASVDTVEIESPPTTRGPPDMTISPITPPNTRRPLEASIDPIIYEPVPISTRGPPDASIDPIIYEPVPIRTRAPPDATIKPITIDPNPFEPIKPEPQIPICAVKCKLEVSPRCGEFDGQYQLFSSPCLMLSHYCNTGEKYNQVDMENCQPPQRQIPLRNINSNATPGKFFI